METLERAAEEKQKINASMKEADERVKEMASTIAALKVRDVYMHDLVLTLHRTTWRHLCIELIIYPCHSSCARSVFKCKMQKSETFRLSLRHIRYN